jgi:PAS domain S-box-containing protein
VTNRDENNRDQNNRDQNIRDENSRDHNEERLLRSVAFQNSQAVLLARERAERKLRESNERTSNILESISDAFFVLDTEWRFTYVNPQAEQILAPLNKTRANLLGKNYWQEFPDLLGTALEENFRRAVATKSKVEFDIFYPPLNSWFQLRAYPSREGLSVYFADTSERKRADQAMGLLAAIVDSSDDAIISKNLDGVITSWNKGAERIFGHSAKEAIGQHIFLVIPDDRREEEVGILARLRRGERVDHFPTVRIRKDGSKIDVSLTISPLRDASGQVIGASKVARDITMQKRADVALRESEERFRAIVQATPECVKVVARDGTLLAMNSAGCGMVEAPEEDAIIGQSVYGMISPEFQQKFQEFNESICRGNKGEFEFEIIGLKGTHRWMESHAVPMRNPSTGELVQLAVTRDITARKQADEKLRRSEEELRDLADSIPQLAWMANPDGHIFWYNRGWYEYTGTTLEAMEGSGGRAVHDPEILPSVVQRWKQSIDSGTPFEMEFPLRGADGVFRWFLTRVSPFRDHQGKVTRWFGTNTNIDEHRRLLRSLSDARDQLEKRVDERTTELQSANESLRDLSARLLKVQDDERRRLARELHDSVGQILAALGMNIAVVQEQAHKLDALGARAVSENAELLQQVSKEIRTMSHLLHPPLLEIAGIASALRWYVDGFAERSSIKVDLDLPENFDRLPNELELAVFRIVQECLTNIHRHSESETATISIHQNDTALTIRVQDQGKGIPLEKQLELTETSRGGVGLRGMRERLRQVGGKLELQSDRGGTTVTATVPLVPSAAIKPRPRRAVTRSR